jgi:hypothetical protein
MKNLTNEVIQQSIDLGLTSLGDSGKQVVWLYLKGRGLCPENVAENVEAFTNALRDLFGLGYAFVDKIFCERLSEALEEDLSCYSCFVDCIDNYRDAVDILENNKKTKKVSRTIQ